MAGTHSVNLPGAAASDYMSRMKLGSDGTYRMTLGLTSGSDGYINFGNGTAAQDVRIYRDTTNSLKVDDAAGGNTALFGVKGTASFDNFSGASWSLLVDSSTHRVSIGGGASSNLFTVGNRSTTQIEFSVGNTAIYTIARTSTSGTSVSDTQIVLAMRPTYWNGSASVDVTASMTARATAAGSGIFIWEVPGVECLTLRGDTSVLEVSGDSGVDNGFTITDAGHTNLRARYNKEGAQWGGDSATPDTRIRRTAAKTLTADDAAGGALTLFKVTGKFEVTGNVGFYGTASAAKPTVTGSRAGNAALASLLTGLAGLGLLTDSSS